MTRLEKKYNGVDLEPSQAGKERLALTVALYKTSREYDEIKLKFYQEINYNDPNYKKRLTYIENFFVEEWNSIQQKLTKEFEDRVNPANFVVSGKYVLIQSLNDETKMPFKMIEVGFLTKEEYENTYEGIVYPGFSEQVKDNATVVISNSTYTGLDKDLKGLPVESALADESFKKIFGNLDIPAFTKEYTEYTEKLLSEVRQKISSYLQNEQANKQEAQVRKNEQLAKQNGELAKKKTKALEAKYPEIRQVLEKFADFVKMASDDEDNLREMRFRVDGDDGEDDYDIKVRDDGSIDIYVGRAFNSLGLLFVPLKRSDYDTKKAITDPDAETLPWIPYGNDQVLFVYKESAPARNRGSAFYPNRIDSAMHALGVKESITEVYDALIRAFSNAPDAVDN